MRAVLYTHDMIPITVMDVPQPYWEYLLHRGYILLAVMRPVEVTPIDYCQNIDQLPFSTVRITVERLVRHGQTYMMLFTENEESALLLQATFLPGQQRQLRDIRDEEFAKGFFSAINMR